MHSTVDCVVGQECKPTFDICGAGTAKVYWQEILVKNEYLESSERLSIFNIRRQRHLWR